MSNCASRAFRQACCEVGGHRRYKLLEGVGIIGKTSIITSWSFLILVACSPCAEVGQGRVTEAEVLGIALAEGVAAPQELYSHHPDSLKSHLKTKAVYQTKVAYLHPSRR